MQIISARFGNADHSAAVIKTDERGSVAISQEDTPELWEAMLASGVMIEAFSPIDPKDFLRAVAAEIRYEKETGGITVSGRNIPTDRTSQQKIADVSWRTGKGQTVRFKLPTGFVTLTSAEMGDIDAAVAEHVQLCFDIEGEVVEAINAGTYVTADQVRAAFSAIS